MKKYAGHLKKKLKRAGAVLPVLFLLSGCANEDLDPLVPPQEASYAATERETVVVERGDLIPVFEATLELQGFREDVYRIEADKAADLTGIYEVTSQELLVDVGDRVKAGDVMISFDSETLKKKKRESEAAKAKAVLGLEHYQKLKEIDPLREYDREIEKLKEEIALSDLYISDIQKTYSEINLCAEQDGVVSFIDGSVKDGFIPTGLPVIRVVSDDGYYVMEDPTDGNSTKLRNEQEFHVGEVYTAKGLLSDTEVEVVEKDGDELCFAPVPDTGLNEKTLKLVVEQGLVRDAVYTDRRALIPYNGEYYVYKEQEDGSYRAEKVTPGASVGFYVVITDGVEEGDVLSLPNG